MRSGAGRVASTEPASTSANPIAIPAVNFSSRIVTPSTAATAGLTYVITVARTGPASAISCVKRTNATAVQATARPTTEASTFQPGKLLGSEKAANGRYARAASAIETVTTPSEGASCSQRARMIGPSA